MSTPNFRRGTPDVPVVTPKGEVKWKAKYNGSCDHCGASVTEGETVVKWNPDRTAVICAGHITAKSWMDDE